MNRRVVIFGAGAGRDTLRRLRPRDRVVIGSADCTLMPWLPYFRRAKRLFAGERFASMLTGEVG